MHILFNEALCKVQRTREHLQDKYETFMGHIRDIYGTFMEQMWNVFRVSNSPIIL